MENKGSQIITQSGASGAVVIFFILLFVFAKWGPALPFSVLSQNKGEPMIVSAEGKSVAIPDIAKINVGITETAATLPQVQSSVNKKSQALTNSLKSAGISEEDIKTTNYYISPQSDYQSNPPSITGYQVSINYEVTVKNIEKVNEILSGITQTGANMVGGVSFDLSDSAKAKAENEARNNAVSKAKEKAESLAKASGVTLGKIINVSESYTAGPRPLYMSAAKEALDTASPDIKTGTTEVVLSVSLFYEIR